MSISKEAKEILNRPDLIAKRDRWFQRMQNLFDSVPDSHNEQYVFGVNGILGYHSSDLYTQPGRWVEGCLESLAANYAALDNDTYFRPLCVEYNIYGVHYIDKMFGANVFFKDGQWYNDYLTTPIGSLQMPDLEHNEVWNSTKEAIRAFVEAGVSVPIFGLPTFASTLNIAVNLYGQNILIEMLEEPDNALADLKVINELLCTLHTYCRENIPQSQLQPVISWNRTQPPGFGQLCGCTTQLLSASLYREMIAPLDDALLSVYPGGGMIHLCGSHTQHMETFRNMKSLRAIQINDRAAADLKAYYEGLRKDQIIYLNPCKEASVEDALAITGGDRLIIADNLAHPIPAPDKALIFP